MSPRELASNWAAEYGVPLPATVAALIRGCRRAGIRVRYSTRLRSWGYFVPGNRPLIILRAGAPAWILAHEVSHSLTSEDCLEIQAYSGEEAFAEAFAFALCRK